MISRNSTFLLILFIFILLLFLRFAFHFSKTTDVKPHQVVTFEHTFLEKPMKNDFQQYFYVENLLITVPLFPEFNYGDRVKIKGAVENYTTQNNEKKLILKDPEVVLVEDKLLKPLIFIRERVSNAYNLVLPPREAGLISGIVLGSEDGINEAFKDELIRSGTLHVVVASGSNIVLIAGLAMSIFLRLFKRTDAIFFTILVIFLYALLTGFDPPIVRASLMASFGFIGMILGRQRAALISLFISGFVMVMISPNLLFDVGFQLSFSATLGIIIFQKIIELSAYFIPKFLKEDFSTTFSAQIGAIPFLLFTFGQVNILSIIINLVLLWTVPIIMILGLVSAALSLVSPHLSMPFLLITLPFLTLFSEVVKIGSHLYIPLSIESAYLPIAIIYYLIMIYILGKLKFKS